MKHAGQTLRRLFPFIMVVTTLVVIWYVAAVPMNSDLLIRGYQRANQEWSFPQLVADAYSMKRPVLPAPHQVAIEIWETTVNKRITSKRSLLHHSWLTLGPTVLGFVFGVALGGILAIGIVHNKTLESSLMPWIVASQTVPILALAPMVIVILGALGFTGLLPKAVISMYLSFFPIVIGMVKGLRSPAALQLNLLRTYNASSFRVFRSLRLPASAPFLFASMKLAVAVSLVGAIVGELPTGAQGGLGSRLLTGSYYGQTIQIWSALLAAALIGALLVGLVGLIERTVLARMGLRQ